MTRRALRRALPLLAVLFASVVFVVASFAAGNAITIDSGPSGLTNDASPEFAFHGPAGTHSYECRLNGGAWSPCQSPWSPAAAFTPDGSYLFEVRGKATGGADPAPAYRSFVLDTQAPPLTIKGPEEPVDDTTATVNFESSEAGIEIACAIDSGEFAPCTSPFTTGDLPNGQHSANVRATDEAGNETVRSALFQIAAVPPETAIAGPEGTTSEQNPLFTLSSNRARATFECNVDDAGWQSCPASYKTPDLTPGAHTFAARAVDPAGNVDDTPALREFEVIACETEVRIGVLVARSECFQRDGAVYSTDKPVRLNGITINPLEGARYTFDTAQRKVGMKDVQFRMDDIVLHIGGLEWTVPEGDRVRLACINFTTFRCVGDAPAGDREAALDGVGDDSSNIFGLELKGEATIDLVPNGAELEAHIELPEVFADAEGRGLTGEITVAADADTGVRVASARVDAPEAFLGDLEVKNLFLSFTGESSGDAKPTCNSNSPGLRWDGGAELVRVPFEEPLEIHNAAFGFADGGFSYARGEWLGGVPGREIGRGVRIQRIALSLCTGPQLRLEGRVSLSAIPGPHGSSRLSIPDAGFIFRAPQGDPWTFRVEAPRATFIGDDQALELTNTFVELNRDNAITFGSHLRFGMGLKGSVPGVGDLDAAVNIDADASGFIDGPLFNARLAAQGCFDGRFNVLGTVPVNFNGVCADAEGVVSSTGAAFCAGIKVGGRDLGRIGAGANWGNPVQFMARSCDVGPWVVQGPQPVAARGGGVRAARVDMPRGRGSVIALRGVDGPPQVVLHGPHGQRIPTPARPGQIVKTSRSFAFQNVVTKETYVVVAGSDSGRWTARPVDGDAVARVRTARMLPRPAVRAAVRGRGRSRTLAWRTKPRPGQRVVFVERGRGVARVIGVARGAHGRMRFKAADGPGGRRVVEAIVEQDGRPRSRVGMTAYRAPRPVMPAKPGAVSVLRSRDNVRVTWGRSRHARRFGVRVELSDGRRLFFLRDARDRFLSLRGVGRRRDVSVRVVGLRATGRVGPAAIARSKGASR